MIGKKKIQAFHEPHRILLREDEFVYIMPHPALRDWISNYTVTFPNRKILSENYTVIPHGSATLVFSHAGNGLYGHIFGPMTKPCVVGGLANQCNMLCIIEFQPAGLFAFTGMNQKELANQIIPFEPINSPLNRTILEALESADSLEELIGLLDRCLLENVYAAYPSELRAATKLIIERAGNIPCKELSSAVYYSQRHLNRLFENHLGMSTKTFSRLVRINKAIRLMHTTQCSITCASLETGFFDLSHFIHDFESVCGMTPQEYRSNMSDFYSEIAKF